MQRELDRDDKALAGKKPPTNYDFSVQRCKTEKLAELMSYEKATMILQIPVQRSSTVNDKTIVEDCFKHMIHRRLRVKTDDPEYDDKIEKRHVLDGELDTLLHKHYY